MLRSRKAGCTNSSSESSSSRCRAIATACTHTHRADFVSVAGLVHAACSTRCSAVAAAVGEVSIAARALMAVLMAGGPVQSSGMWLALRAFHAILGA